MALIGDDVMNISIGERVERIDMSDVMKVGMKGFRCLLDEGLEKELLFPYSAW